MGIVARAPAMGPSPLLKSRMSTRRYPSYGVLSQRFRQTPCRLWKHHAVTRLLHTRDRLAEVESLQQLVGDQLYDLMDDSACALFGKSEDVTAADPTFWYRLFAGI